MEIHFSWARFLLWQGSLFDIWNRRPRMAKSWMVFSQILSGRKLHSHRLPPACYLFGQWFGSTFFLSSLLPNFFSWSESSTAYSGNLERTFTDFENTKKLKIEASFTPDSQYLVSGLIPYSYSIYLLSCPSPSKQTNQQIGSENGKVHMWKIQNGKSLCALKGHSLPVTCVKFNPHYMMMASACQKLVSLYPCSFFFGAFFLNPCLLLLRPGFLGSNRKNFRYPSVKSGKEKKHEYRKCTDWLVPESDFLFFAKKERKQQLFTAPAFVNGNSNIKVRSWSPFLNSGVLFVFFKGILIEEANLSFIPY